MRGRHRHPALTRCRPRTSRYDAALRSEHPSSRRHGAIGHSRRPESLRETFQASFRIRPHTSRIVESTVSPSSPIYPESPVNPFLAGSHAAGGVLILSFFFLTICSEVNENKETDKANIANDAFFLQVTPSTAVFLLHFLHIAHPRSLRRRRALLASTMRVTEKQSRSGGVTQQGSQCGQDNARSGGVSPSSRAVTGRWLAAALVRSFVVLVEIRRRITLSAFFFS